MSRTVMIERHDHSRTRMPLYPDGRGVKKRGLNSKITIRPLPSGFNDVEIIKGFGQDEGGQRGRIERHFHKPSGLSLYPDGRTIWKRGFPKSFSDGGLPSRLNGLKMIKGFGQNEIVRERGKKDNE